MVKGQQYVGKLTVEYNRHDKRFYIFSEMTLAELLEESHKEPILVYAGTVWCAPCRALKAILAELSGIRIIEMDIDDPNNDKFTEHYKIRSIPTLLFLERGELIDKTVGSISKANILNRIETLWPTI